MAITNEEIKESPEIEALFEAGAHIGYGKSRRHPKMGEYIFGTRNNVEIFDLGRTAVKIKEAEEFLKSLGKTNKKVFWVGTKASAAQHIKSAGEKTNMPYVSERWLGGTLTNFKIFEQRLSYWFGLEADEKSGGLDKYSKKERLMKITELKKLGRMFGGLRQLKTIPEALIVVDPCEEKTAFAEAKRKNIPIIAILNVDCSPEGISYPIPANDNSSSTTFLILERLVSAYESGLQEKAVSA